MPPTHFVSDVATYFVFFYKYGACIKKKLCKDLGKTPTHQEYVSRVQSAFYHMQRIRHFRYVKHKTLPKYNLPTKTMI